MGTHPIFESDFDCLTGLKRAMSDVVEKIEDIAVNKSGAGDAEEKKAVVERPPSPELNPEDDKDDEKESKGAAKDEWTLADCGVALDDYDVNLEHERLGVIEGLEGLHQVECLCLRNNLVRKMENLSMLTTLTELDLYDNILKKMEGIDTLTNLTMIELGANRIRKIENLETIKGLQELYLAGNKISKIENIKTL